MARGWIQYGSLLAELKGKPLAERGRLALDGRACFLATAGRAVLRRERAGSGSLAGPGESDTGNVWAWAVETEGALIPDARIFLNIPDTRFYYLTATLWFPRRVEVSVRPGLIRDQATLEAVIEAADPARWRELRERGFTHLVGLEGGSPRVVALTESSVSEGRP